MAKHTFHFERVPAGEGYVIGLYRAGDIIGSLSESDFLEETRAMGYLIFRENGVERKPSTVRYDTATERGGVSVMEREDDEAEAQEEVEKQERRVRERQIDKMKAPLRERMYFVINHFLGDVGMERFDLDEAFQYLAADERVQELKASMGDDAAEVFVTTVKEQIKKIVRDRKDRYGLREFVSIGSHGQEQGDYWRFQSMRAEQLRILVAERETAVREHLAQIEAFKKFLASVEAAGPDARVRDVYDKVVASLDGSK